MGGTAATKGTNSSTSPNTAERRNSFATRIEMGGTAATKGTNSSTALIDSPFLPW